MGQIFASTSMSEEQRKALRLCLKWLNQVPYDIMFAFHDQNDGWYDYANRVMHWVNPTILKAQKKGIYVISIPSHRIVTLTDRIIPANTEEAKILTFSILLLWLFEAIRQDPTGIKLLRQLRHYGDTTRTHIASTMVYNKTLKNQLDLLELPHQQLYADEFVLTALTGASLLLFGVPWFNFGFGITPDGKRHPQDSTMPHLYDLPRQKQLEFEKKDRSDFKRLRHVDRFYRLYAEVAIANALTDPNIYLFSNYRLTDYWHQAFPESVE